MPVVFIGSFNENFNVFTGSGIEGRTCGLSFHDEMARQKLPLSHLQNQLDSPKFIAWFLTQQQAFTHPKIVAWPLGISLEVRFATWRSQRFTARLVRWRRVIAAMRTLRLSSLTDDLVTHNFGGAQDANLDAMYHTALQTPHVSFHTRTQQLAFAVDITVDKCGRPAAGAAFIAAYNASGKLVNRFADFCGRCPDYAQSSKIPAVKRHAEYARYVLQSRYGFSPPGMGYDCYRTWEVSGAANNVICN